MKPILKKFKRICPHCGEEFYQKKYINKSIDFKYALDGFPITHTDICFDVYAFDYATCPKCGFCYPNKNELNEVAPIIMIPDINAIDKRYKFLMDSYNSCSFQDKMMSYFSRIDPPVCLEMEYRFGLQNNLPQLLEFTRKKLIKLYEDKNIDKSLFNVFIKNGGFLSVNKLKNISFPLAYTLPDLYRQNGDFKKAKKIVKEYINLHNSAIQNNPREEKTHKMFLSYFEEEQNLIDKKIIDRV